MPTILPRKGSQQKCIQAVDGRTDRQYRLRQLQKRNLLHVDAQGPAYERLGHHAPMAGNERIKRRLETNWLDLKISF